MAFIVGGFRTVDFMFHPSGDPGSNLSIHKYVTNDDRATVETAGYFNALAKRVKVGDHIDMTIDLDGTPLRRNYIVTSVAGGVVAIAAQNIAA